jgi:hypothetical protein
MSPQSIPLQWFKSYFLGHSEIERVEIFDLQEMLLPGFTLTRRRCPGRNQDTSNGEDTDDMDTGFVKVGPAEEIIPDEAWLVVTDEDWEALSIVEADFELTDSVLLATISERWRRIWAAAFHARPH